MTDISDFTSLISLRRHDNLANSPCILLNFFLLVRNCYFSNKFNNDEKKSKWPIYLILRPNFTSQVR